MSKREATMNRAQEFLACSTAILTLAAILSACTMHKPTMTTVGSDAYVTKSDIQGKTYHLVRGVEEADSDNNFGAIPGFAEDFGLVRADITETELRFLKAFDPSGRAETAQVVASYTIIKHFDIDRQKNDFNEDTNKLVEDDTTNTWDKRALMRVDWANPTNSLSDYKSTLDGYRVREKNPVMKEDPVIDQGHISFATEVNVEGKSYRLLQPFGEFQTLETARVTYRTHLLPVKDTDFKPVPYDLDDFKRFGFFVTQQDYLDPEKGHTDASQKIYAQVYNVCEPGTQGTCSTNQIKWVLTENFPEFYKPEARAAVLAWNQTFKDALGRKDDVVVLDESKQVSLSDPTANVIAYYDARAGGGLLGVAQGVVDPRTGEKVSSRATIYGDGIRYEQGRIDEMITMLSQNSDLAIQMNYFKVPKSPQNAIKSPYHAGEYDPKSSGLTNQLKLAGFHLKNVTSNGAIGNKGRKTGALIPPATLQDVYKSAGIRPKAMSTKSLLPTGLAMSPRSSDPAYLQGNKIADSRLKSLMTNHPDLFKIPDIDLLGGIEAPVQIPEDSPLNNYKNLGGMQYVLMLKEIQKIEREGFLRQNNAGVHGSELVDDASIRFLIREARRAKTPQDLVNEKQDLKNRLAKQIFYITLLHEMGHTFGLRHNFMGSADQKHYPPEWSALKARLDAKEPGITDDDLVPYASSSIMDYMDFFEQQAGLAPYDKAAIKYGYRRSLDREQDPIVHQGFLFCTDEQVLSDLRCQRFDRGATLSEIVENTTKKYQQNWVLTHVRDGRESFEHAERSLITRNLMNVFLPMRLVFDEMQFSLMTASPSSTAASSTSCPFEFWQDSINKNEMVNICDGAALPSHGIDPTDLSTFGRAVDPGINSRDLTPYGMADLLRASTLVQKFFGDVIGSFEPGYYLADPSSTDLVGNLALTPMAYRLPPGASKADYLRAFINDQTKGQLAADKVDSIVTQNLNNVLFVPFGTRGKPYMSVWTEKGGHYQLQIAGSIFDKLAAVYALGLSGFGIPKYENSGMVTNAYLYQFSRGFMSSIFHDMIISDNVTLHSAMNFKLDGGQSIVATIPAKLDQNIQESAVLIGLTSLVSDLDMSFQDKLQLCALGDPSCANPVGFPSVQALSSSLNKTYLAIQTPQGDSISYDLVKNLAAASKNSTTFINALRTSDTTRQNDLSLLKNSSDTRLRVLRNLTLLTADDLKVSGLTQDDLKAIHNFVTIPGPNDAPTGVSALSELVSVLAQGPAADIQAYAAIAQKVLDDGNDAVKRSSDAVTKKLAAVTMMEIKTPPACPEGPMRPNQAAAPAPGATPSQPAPIALVPVTPADASAGQKPAVGAANSGAAASPLDSCVNSDGALAPTTLQQIATDVNGLNALVIGVAGNEVNIMIAPVIIKRTSDDESKKELIVDYIQNIIRLLAHY